MVLLDPLFMVILAFLLETVDASIGMGYGTILSPVLLMIGFDPLQVVPAVLVSQLAGDFLAAFFHHEFKNVDLSVGSKHFKVAVTLSLLGLGGSMIAVAIAVNLPKLLINLYIGMLFAIIGFIVLATKNKNYDFSWTRLLSLGCLAAFNKGISGGGYGPLVTTGQILAGVRARSAIGIISLAEGVTCVVALLMYVLIGRGIDWPLSITLSIGVVLSTPLAASFVRKIESTRLRLIIGIATLLLGLSTILRTLGFP
ncbi:TSUP family transporter [Candidatus Bathyarchaeota archaeon]|nr:TSUP family transporter [Candidatus Bathyarchaeota archaeon]